MGKVCLVSENELTSLRSGVAWVTLCSQPWKRSWARELVPVVSLRPASATGTMTSHPGWGGFEVLSSSTNSHLLKQDAGGPEKILSQQWIS